MPQDCMPKRDMPHDCMPNYCPAHVLILMTLISKVVKTFKVGKIESKGCKKAKIFMFEFQNNNMRVYLIKKTAF